MDETEDEALPTEETVESKSPTGQYVGELFAELMDYHSVRNKWVKEARLHIMAEHSVEQPQEGQYIRVHKVNLWSFRTFLNERLARFLPVPRIRILPAGIGDPALAQASSIEKAINASYYWMRRGSGDAWGRALADVLIAEAGVIRWEANAAAAWPKLIRDPETEEDEITREMPLGDEMAEFLSEEELEKSKADALKARKKARNDYKRSQPFPVSQTYVPIEAYYPAPDSDRTEECIEIEFKSMRSVKKNKLFDPVGLAKLGALEGADKFKSYVPILRYANGEVYAYYALPIMVSADGVDDIKETVLSKFLDEHSGGGAVEAVWLYAYEHGLGRPNYTEIGGMHGGWAPGDHRLVVGKIKALTDTDTRIDELASQGWTSIRESMWPTWKIMTSNDRPVSSADSVDPLAPPDPKVMRSIRLYQGEDITPMLPAREHPLYQQMMDKLYEVMAKIGGAPGLSGIHQSGVEGGFQENTLLQQADSQFARIEMNIVTGAQDGALMFIDLCRVIGEEIFVRAKARDNTSGREYFEELVIDPAKLEPRPEVDAIVKAKPVGNDAIALRNYASAVTDVNGPASAAMTRNKARAEFLDMEQPDDESVGVSVERALDQVAGEVVNAEIKKAYNLDIIQDAIRGIRNFNPEELLAGDPELAAQAGMFMSGQPIPPPPGTMPPPPAGDPSAQGMGLQTGLPEGVGQPEAAQGRADQIMMDQMGQGQV